MSTQHILHHRRRLIQKASRVACEALESRQLLTAIVAEFTDGNGTGSVDRYAGTGGSGWSAGWVTNTNNGSYTSGPTVVNISPLNANGNLNYAATTFTTSSNKSNGVGAIARGYTSTGNVSTTGIHQVQFDFRI